MRLSAVQLPWLRHQSGSLVNQCLEVFPGGHDALSLDLASAPQCLLDPLPVLGDGCSQETSSFGRPHGGRGGRRFGAHGGRSSCREGGGGLGRKLLCRCL